MPLICEIKNKQGCWQEINQLLPGDMPTSISHWSTMGEREIYILMCEPDDSHSSILKAIGDVEINPSSATSYIAALNVQLEQEIRNGDLIERTFLTDQSLTARELRFRHVTIDFELRTCLVCGQNFSTAFMTIHISDHTKEELDSWGSETLALLRFCRTSLIDSLAPATGFPRVQKQIQDLLTAVEESRRNLVIRSN